MLFAGVVITVLGVTFWQGWAAGLATMGVFWVLGGVLLISQEAREKAEKRAAATRTLEQDKFWREQLGKEEK